MDRLVEDIFRALQKSEAGFTARDLSKTLGVSKTEINRVLYASRSMFVNDGSRVPIWKTIAGRGPSQSRTVILKDRINPPIIIEKTIKVDVLGKSIDVDIAMVENSRNDDLYSLEIKSINHILISVSRIFEGGKSEYNDGNLKSQIQAWQLVLVALGILDYVFSAEPDYQIGRFSKEFSILVRKLTAQLSNI